MEPIKTIEVTNCLTCPFYHGGVSTDYECTHEDGPDGEAVSKAVNRVHWPVIAVGCPLEGGTTVVRLAITKG